MRPRKGIDAVAEVPRGVLAAFAPNARASLFRFGVSGRHPAEVAGQVRVGFATVQRDQGVLDRLPLPFRGGCRWRRTGDLEPGAAAVGDRPEARRGRVGVAERHLPVEDAAGERPDATAEAAAGLADVHESLVGLVSNAIETWVGRQRVECLAVRVQRELRRPLEPHPLRRFDPGFVVHLVGGLGWLGVIACGVFERVLSWRTSGRRCGPTRYLCMPTAH